MPSTESSSSSLSSVVTASKPLTADAASAALPRTGDSRSSSKSPDTPAKEESRTCRPKSTATATTRISTTENTTTKPITTTKTLFVANLSTRLQYSHLEKLFSKYGIIIRLDIRKSTTTTSSNTCYCFCEFDTLEQAQLCQRQLQGRPLLHRRLVIQEAHQQQQQHGNMRGMPSQQQHRQRNRTIRQEQQDVSKKIQEIKAKLAKK